MGAGSDSYYEYLLKLWLLGVRDSSAVTEATSCLLEMDIALAPDMHYVLVPNLLFCERSSESGVVRVWLAALLGEAEGAVSGHVGARHGRNGGAAGLSERWPAPLGGPIRVSAPLLLPASCQEPGQHQRFRPVVRQRVLLCRRCG